MTRYDKSFCFYSRIFEAQNIKKFLLLLKNIGSKKHQQDSAFIHRGKGLQIVEAEEG